MSTADLLEKELSALMDADGLIKPEAVVAWAKSHPKSALHGQFEWNDDKAASEHRIWQARRLISLHIVSEEGERKFVSLTVDRTKDGGGYRSVKQVMKVKALREILLRDALAELTRTREKYARVKELSAVFEQIDHAEKKHGGKKAAA